MPKTRKFGEKVMVVWEMTDRGVLSLIRVPPKVKVNADYYIEHVLKPLLESEVIKFCGEEACKVFVHHDAAPAHTANKTKAYGQELKTKLGIPIIDKEHILVKAPDTSPLDFYGFGYLKHRL